MSLCATISIMSSTKIKHQLTSNVKLLHKVALVFQDKVLTLKRASDASSRPGKWDLPGGNSEWPENKGTNEINPHQLDVSREIEEETGFDVPTDTFTLQNLAYFATYFEAEREIFSVNCGWIVSLEEFLSDHETTPQATISSEHTDYQWITLDQLDQYDFGGPERDYETAIIRRALG